MKHGVRTEGIAETQAAEDFGGREEPESRQSWKLAVHEQVSLSRFDEHLRAYGSLPDVPNLLSTMNTKSST